MFHDERQLLSIWSVGDACAGFLAGFCHVPLVLFLSLHIFWEMASSSTHGIRLWSQLCTAHPSAHDPPAGGTLTRLRSFAPFLRHSWPPFVGDSLLNSQMDNLMALLGWQMGWATQVALCVGLSTTLTLVLSFLARLGSTLRRLLLCSKPLIRFPLQIRRLATEEQHSNFTKEAVFAWASKASQSVVQRLRIDWLLKKNAQVKPESGTEDESPAMQPRAIKALQETASHESAAHERLELKQTHHKGQPELLPVEPPMLPPALALQPRKKRVTWDTRFLPSEAGTSGIKTPSHPKTSRLKSSRVATATTFHAPVVEQIQTMEIEPNQPQIHLTSASQNNVVQAVDTEQAVDREQFVNMEKIDKQKGDVTNVVSETEASKNQEAGS